jgi:hypothetical protein
MGDGKVGQDVAKGPTACRGMRAGVEENEGALATASVKFTYRDLTVDSQTIHERLGRRLRTKRGSQSPMHPKDWALPVRRKNRE